MHNSSFTRPTGLHSGMILSITDDFSFSVTGTRLYICLLPDYILIGVKVLESDPGKHIRVLANIR